MRSIEKKSLKVLLYTSIVSAVIFAGCAVKEPALKVSEDEKKSAISQANIAIKTVGGAMKTHLIKEMKKGGPANAAGFCANSASDIAKTASQTLPKGVSVKRITNKPRNTQNKANGEQLKVLNELDQLNKDGKLPKMLVKKISENHYTVYKPLTIGKKCLTCHGEMSNRNKDAYDVIKQKYPNDKAVDYKVGELRGAFLVDIIK